MNSADYESVVVKGNIEAMWEEYKSLEQRYVALMIKSHEEKHRYEWATTFLFVCMVTFAILWWFKL